MPEAVIVSAVRSPIGRAHKGSLIDLRADEMVTQMLSALVAAVPDVDPSETDDLILGTSAPVGEIFHNAARVTAVLAGWDSVPGTTVNRYCASSLQTTRMAVHAIRAGEGHAFISAGVESVSRTSLGMPTTDLRNPRFAGARARSAEASVDDPVWSDPRSNNQLPDVHIGMGLTAEYVARKFGVSRQDQDEFAARSQHRAQEAADSGRWAQEITPLRLPDGTEVVADDSPRRDVTVEALADLRPVFLEGGSVTAGNSCPLNDGAAALLLMSDTRARELGCRPLARVVATGLSGLSPEIMGMGTVESTKRALDLAGLQMSDIDLVEINEAFAAQAVASVRELGIPDDKVNIHGGAIALGHPFGMTGARITTTLINNLTETDSMLGLVTMCVGGGQGMAMIIERMS